MIKPNLSLLLNTPGFYGEMLRHIAGSGTRQLLTSRQKKVIRLRRKAERQNRKRGRYYTARR